MFLSQGAWANDAVALFEAGNRLYEQGQFVRAAATFEKLVAEGKRSGPVLFNLGNACFKAGQIGKAIAAYHQAARLTPGDPDIQANLEYARSQRAGPSRSAGRWEHWLGEGTLNRWTLLACAAYWGLLLALALGQFQPAWRGAVRRVRVVSAALLLVLGVCVGAAWNNSNRTLAVVVQPEVAVRNGPLEESQAAFVVHDGAELEIRDRKDKWVQVSAGPSQVGWVPEESLILL